MCAVAYVWVGRLSICFNRCLGLVFMMNTPAIASEQKDQDRRSTSTYKLDADQSVGLIRRGSKQ